MAKRHVVIPVFVPHKGCNFDCIYCNQKIISGQTEEMTVKKMREIIDSHLFTILPDTKIEIGFFGGSFTGMDLKYQEELLECANTYITKGLINGIKLSTRPDYISESILDFLKYYNVKTVELGAQSLNDSVLSKINRGHTAKDVAVASEQIIKKGFQLGIQTMIGLPYSCKELDFETSKMVVSLNPSFVRIYPTLIIKGTYLEKLYHEKKYTPLNLDQAVDISSKIYQLYVRNNIIILRVGLMASDNINFNKDLVAGPFHPAFRQLIESKLALQSIENEIIQKNYFGISKLEIYTNNRNVSNIVGQKRTNIDYLRIKYGINKINIIENNSIIKDFIIVCN